MKRLRKTIITLTAAMTLLAAIFYFLQWSGLLILIPKINGTVTLHQNDSSQTFHFSDRGGEYGEYDWLLGSDELPIAIRLFSRNNRHVLSMDFDVKQADTQWHITGEVRVKGYETMQYERFIPLSEPLAISVDCFP